jgi:hypothetical protein
MQRKRQRARVEVARALEVEAESRAILVLLVDHDQVAGLQQRPDRIRKLRRTEHRRKRLQGEMNREQEAEPSTGQSECRLVRSRAASQQVRYDWTEQQANCRDGQRRAEQAERLRI